LNTNGITRNDQEILNQGKRENWRQKRICNIVAEHAGPSRIRGNPGHTTLLRLITVHHTNP
jgi:hypothetical protein